MKHLKKMLALVLAICLCIGLIPGTTMAANAAETPQAAAIFASDIHEESTGTSGNGTSALKAVLSKIGENGVTYNTMGFVGDTYTDKAGTMAAMTSAAQTALGQSAEVYYAWGDHDEESDISEDSGLMYSGDYYYIYHISDIHMRDKADDGNSSTITATQVTEQITEFKTAAAAMDKSKVLFIMSHAPLHDRRDDNTWANNWYTAIKEVADKMDVVVFWAHNHTSEDDVDRAAYYVEKDGSETMTIYGGDTIVPNFTYMNAGYIYAAGQNPSRKGVATTVEIYSDSMVFQDYNSSGEYTDSNYSHNVTVPREFAVTTPTEQTYYSDDLFAAITATAESATVTEFFDEDDETKVSDLLSFWYGYDFALEGQVEDTSTTITLWLEPSGANPMTSANLGVYYYNEETGEYEEVTEYDVATDEDGVEYITISNAKLGTYVYGTPAEAAIPAGASLTGLNITEPEKVYYFLDQENLSPAGTPYLDITGLGVKAVYTYEDETYTKTLAWNEFDEEVDGYALAFESLLQPGKKTVTVSYEGVSEVFNVWVCAESISSDETLNVNVTFDTPCVIDMAITTVESEKVDTAVADLLAEGYVTYDFTATYGGTYTALDGTANVTVPIPDGVENPAVYYVSTSGKTERMPIVDTTDTTVTFETTHFSTFVVGDSTEIEVPETETATGSETTTTTETKTVYVLSSGNPSGNVLIADSATEGDVHLVANDDGDLSNTTSTVIYGDADGDGDKEYYIELTDATNELWTVSNSYRFANQDEYLRCSNGSLSVSSQSTTWSYSSNRLSYTSSSNGGNGKPGSGSSSTTYYLCYNDGWTVTSSASSIYFYAPTEVEVETETTVSGTYSIEGKDLSVAVSSGSTANLTSTLTFATESGEVSTEDVSTTATYEVVTVDVNGNTVDGDPKDIISKIENGVVTFTGNYGKALVKVSYETKYGTVTDYITIEAKAPYYTIQLHKAEMTEVTITEFADGVTYYTFNDTTGNYQVATEYVEGTTYYTTPVIQGDMITSTIALKGVEAGDTYSVWAVVKEYSSENPGGEDLGKLGDALTWTVSDTSIATIDTETGLITFTGENYGTFTVTVAYELDSGEVITDTIKISVTKSLYVVPGDGTNDFPEYPNEGAVRFDKTASAVGNFSETGIALVELSMTGVPYTTDNAMDVVVMLDMTGSMSDNGMEAAEEATKAFVEKIVKNEDGSYNSNRVAVYAFNSGSNSPYELVALDSISSDTELETANTAIDTASDKQTSGGTPFDEATKQCYDVLQAAKTNLPEGETTYTRQQFCVFMSDGGPTTYYGSDEKTYYGGNNTSGDVTIVSKMTNYTSTTASEWSMDLPTEYYTDLMKADGVTIYTVGLLLQNTPNNPAPWSAMNGVSSVYDSDTDSLTTVGTHYFFTSEILKQMATDASKYIDIFSVDNATNATAKFTAIAQSILEAAKNVVVEDKIGDNYSVNFSLPTNVNADKTDGLSEFYIQAVEYQLNSDKERTGDPTVLENFTFNADGTLKSHTVDGVTCTDCSHVTITDGVVTLIDGTYFDYLSNDTGEYLTWKVDKITTTEYALQYFAHLNNSSDAVGTDKEIPAGTYYTNEYATLTYTNYNNKQVQQEFPVPQMTWNGAQVSYVFYLVNDAGQPVNRAGRVVPFAEAVYVTDVYTYSVIWNDLEQAAGLEADYLAEEIVPDVYELYDDDAFYNIHVYEDENKNNLNNHFVIGGDVTDDYNVTTHSWTNANTTYVFNNKSDAEKYSATGTYIANDGDDTKTSATYLGKGDGTVTATISEATDVTAETFASKPYFTMVDGKYVLAAAYVADTTYYEIVSASYVAVSGETQASVNDMESTSGGTVIDDHIYYIDDEGNVYTIVQKTDGKEVRTGFDFHNTTVAFAVVWKPALEEDTVVVDYGLDVVVDVITNDAMAAGVTGVMLDAPNAETDGTYDTPIGKETVTGGDGLWTASVENLTSVRFHQNEIGLKEPEVFYYEAGVNYYKTGETTVTTTNMYSSVTVIPATTIYYEDEFVELATSVTTTTTTIVTDVETTVTVDGEVQEQSTNTTTKVISTNDKGTTTTITSGENVTEETTTITTPPSYKEGTTTETEENTNEDGSTTTVVTTTTVSRKVVYGAATTGWDVNSSTASKTQAVDRPGMTKSMNEAYDANNVYGYDGAYASLKTFSMDSAAMVNVNASKSAQASFSFYGTGFDVISMTDTTTGTIIVNVYAVDSEGNVSTTKTKSLIVDTYYGMNADGTLSENNPNALYQVPVMKVNGLTYGRYHVEIIAAYADLFDHNNSGSYDFYLDAIRIYDPANDGADNITIENAYKADNEGWPVYEEVRNNVIKAAVYDSTSEESEIAGVVFIDTTDETASVADYINYGPNNELYLASGQAIAFNLDLSSYVNAEGESIVAAVQIGLKSADGNDVEYKIFDGSAVDEQSDIDELLPTTISTATDMYYNITSLKDKTIVIYNSGTAGILSITNVKVTFKENPGTVGELFYVASDVVEKVLANMSEVEIDLGEITVSTYPGIIYVGEEIQVTVTTSEEVTAISVNNGDRISDYEENEEGNRLWISTITANTSAGPQEIAVTIYGGENEEANKKEIATVNVVDKFAPEAITFSTTPSTVYVGNTFTLITTTSTDVACISVDGTLITSYTDTGSARIWKVTLTANKTAGNQTVNVIAYDANGLESNPFTATVTVDSVETWLNTTIGSIVNKLRQWLKW